jgi:uncharacterized membrane protein YfcA
MALKSIFSTFLAVIAIRMLLPAKSAVASGAAETGPWLYRAAGGLIGMAGSLIGAGGGIFMVPFLSSRGHKMAKAVATSTTIGLPVSIVGALIYASEPTPIRTGAMLGFVFLPAFFGLSLGSVIAAPLGAKIASRAPTPALKSGFAVILMVLAIRTLLG